MILYRITSYIDPDMEIKLKVTNPGIALDRKIDTRIKELKINKNTITKLHRLKEIVLQWILVSWISIHCFYRTPA